MLNSEKYSVNTLPYNILRETDLKTITEAIFTLMRDTGIKFGRDPRVMDLFSAAGCDISSEGIVKFPTELVLSSLDSVGKRVKLYNRSGTDFIEISTDSVTFSAGTTAVNIIDPETGERRPTKKDDLAAICRIADALSDIDAVSLPCKIIDKPDVYGEIDEFKVMLENTTKPLLYISENVESLRAAIEMASAVRGGIGQLKEKPYFIFWVTPMPLYFPQQRIDQIFLAIENDIPVEVGTNAIGGATGPITIAGNLINVIATSFGGLVLTQLIKKGSICLDASIPSYMDPRTANISGIAESPLAEMARGQITRMFGLPTCGSLSGCSNAAYFNQYTAAVSTASMLHLTSSRISHSQCVGLIEMGLTYSPHLLVFCNEMANLIRYTIRGIKVDNNTLAMDLIENVGLEGSYFGEKHTAKNCRTEIWPNKYLKSTNYEQWQKEGAHDLVDMIDSDLKKILLTHEIEPLEKTVCDKIDVTLKEFTATEK